MLICLFKFIIYAYAFLWGLISSHVRVFSIQFTFLVDIIICVMCLSLLWNLCVKCYCNHLIFPPYLIKPHLLIPNPHVCQLLSHALCVTVINRSMHFQETKTTCERNRNTKILSLYETYYWKRPMTSFAAYFNIMSSMMANIPECSVSRRTTPFHSELGPNRGKLGRKWHSNAPCLWQISVERSWV